MAFEYLKKWGIESESDYPYNKTQVSGNMECWLCCIYFPFVCFQHELSECFLFLFCFVFVFVFVIVFSSLCLRSCRFFSWFFFCVMRPERANLSECFFFLQHERNECCFFIFLFCFISFHFISFHFISFYFIYLFIYYYYYYYWSSYFLGCNNGRWGQHERSKCWFFLCVCYLSTSEASACFFLFFLCYEASTSEASAVLLLLLLGFFFFFFFFCLFVLFFFVLFLCVVRPAQAKQVLFSGSALASLVLVFLSFFLFLFLFFFFLFFSFFFFWSS